MTKRRTYDRQIEMVRNLAIPPHGYDEVREYKVDQWENKYKPGQATLCVTRAYGRTGQRMARHECITIGPRGAKKTIYDNFI
jgi:hypothetical protein